MVKANFTNFFLYLSKIKLAYLKFNGIYYFLPAPLVLGQKSLIYGRSDNILKKWYPSLTYQYGLKDRSFEPLRVSQSQKAKKRSEIVQMSWYHK